MSCIHLRGIVTQPPSPNGLEGVSVPVCRAFPNPPIGIPLEIWAGRFDHRAAYPGDQGIRWKSNGDPHPAAREEERRP
jgi:hypothetical protein